jgi:hypothetical protein
MRSTGSGSRVSGITVAVLLVTGLLLGSCATTKDVMYEHGLEEAEIIASLEQTRKMILEEDLTYLLGMLFGFENVVVIASSRARYDTAVESEEIESHEDEEMRLSRRVVGPGQIERQTVAVVINSAALTEDEREDIDLLLEKLVPLVANGAGLIMEDDFGDAVSVVFMPFTE